MQLASLDGEIAAFEHLLPDIKRNHGSAWALIADQHLVKTFNDFPSAARYARERFGNREVLIRHTDADRAESAPFVHVPRAED